MAHTKYVPHVNQAISVMVNGKTTKTLIDSHQEAETGTEQVQSSAAGFSAEYVGILKGPKGASITGQGSIPELDKIAGDPDNDKIVTVTEVDKTQGSKSAVKCIYRYMGVVQPPTDGTEPGQIKKKTYKIEALRFYEKVVDGELVTKFDRDGGTYEQGGKDQYATIKNGAGF